MGNRMNKPESPILEIMYGDDYCVPPACQILLAGIEISRLAAGESFAALEMSVQMLRF